MIRQQKLAPSGTLILDHLPNRNALSREMVDKLIEGFSDFHREKTVRAVMLTASGTTFCSGVDLKEWQETSATNEPFEDWQDIATQFQELIEIMLRYPKPIIALVDGPVLGMGLALVLAADLVIASNNATFEIPAPKFGLVSGIVTPLLTFRCGGSVAARMLLGGETFNAESAERMNLVHRIVPSKQIWAVGHEWTERIATGAAESIQMTKRLLNEMIGEMLLTHLTSGAAAMATACTTDAAAEGLRAFVEKRTPKFP